jgi:hypothetical protein
MLIFVIWNLILPYLLELLLVFTSSILEYKVLKHAKFSKLVSIYNQAKYSKHSLSIVNNGGQLGS